MKRAILFAALMAVHPIFAQDTISQEMRKHLENLGADYIEDREEAQAALIKMGAAAAPAVLERVGSSDAEVQSRAAGVLKYLGEAALPALLAGLESSNPQVREYAERRIYQGKPIGELISLLAHEQESVRSQAGWILSKEAPEAAYALAELLSAAKADIVSINKAKWKLEQRFGHGAASPMYPRVDALAKIPAEARRGHARTLESQILAVVRQLADRLKRSVKPEDIRTLCSVLSGMGAQGISSLSEYLAPRGFLQTIEAVKALGNAGVKESVDALIVLMEKADYWDDRQAAAEALGKIGGEKAVQALEKNLSKLEEYHTMHSVVKNALTLAKAEIKSEPLWVRYSPDEYHELRDRQNSGGYWGKWGCGGCD